MDLNSLKYGFEEEVGEQSWWFDLLINSELLLCGVQICCFLVYFFFFLFGLLGVINKMNPLK